MRGSVLARACSSNAPTKTERKCKTQERATPTHRVLLNGCHLRPPTFQCPPGRDGPPPEKDKRFSQSFLQHDALTRAGRSRRKSGQHRPPGGRTPGEAVNSNKTLVPGIPLHMAAPKTPITTRPHEPKNRNQLAMKLNGVVWSKGVGRPENDPEGKPINET